LKIFTVNAGSSSIKIKFFDNLSTILSIKIEEIGSTSAKATLKYKDREYRVEDRVIKNHKEAISIIKELYHKADLANLLRDLDIIAHRVVHGGDRYSKALLLSKDSIESIKSFNHLAPLHNPINILAIESFFQEFPTTPQVAIFDTAFHQSMDRVSYSYPLPKDIIEQGKIRRYGFHGISYAYTTKEASKVLNIAQDKINLISLHLGNGASITAIKDGKSVDTSMGMTPLAGLVMGTRCGDIDVSILTYMMKMGYSIEEIENILNYQSGLKALSGTNNIEEITKRYLSGDEVAIDTINTYIHSIIKYIGSYAILLDRVDGIVFFAGVGENSSLIRELIIKKISHLLKTQLNQELNSKKITKPTIISSSKSHIPLLVIPTNEELQMAIEAQEYITQKSV